MGTMDYLLEKRLHRLNPQLHKRFTDTVSILPVALSGYRRLFPEYTDHSMLHSMHVLQFSNTLIGDAQIAEMNAYECYVLLMSCYLHDIGMGIPSPELSFAITQVSRGHRRTDLFDADEYPARLQIGEHSSVRLPYLAAVIRIADEIDVIEARNPKLLYDIEALTDAHQIECNRMLQAVPNMDILPDRFVLDVRIEDKESDKKLLDGILNMAKKMQDTLDLCRAVAEARTPFRISQEKVELNFLDSES